MRTITTSFIVLSLTVTHILSEGLVEQYIQNDTVVLGFNSSATHFVKETLKLNPLPSVRSDFLVNDGKVEPEYDFKSSECQTDEWNIIRTDSLPHDNMHKEYRQRKIGRNSYLYGETPALFGAFALPDQIVVTLTTENLFGKPVYCRYYDCRRKEIMDQFESVVYPESTVFCPRRAGAKYISVTRTLKEEAEYSIPIVPRIGKVQHFFTVCLAPLYGDEPKFLHIAEFIEYHKLQGATFFHVYVRNVSDYDRMLLDDYVRTGDIEVIKMHDHYWRDDWMWHNPQINDCHHRNKHFSKWTAFIDLDERIEMRNEHLPTIIDFLNTLTDPNIINLHFRVQWVIKDQDAPARYISDEQIMNEMLFEKYRNSSQLGSIWNQAKCIIRPDKVAAMSIHDPLAHYKGVKRTLVNETIGHIRHYRNTANRVFPNGLSHMLDCAPFNIRDVAEWIKKPLSKAILKRVEWVYNVKEVSCEMRKYTYGIYHLKYEC